MSNNDYLETTTKKKQSCVDDRIRDCILIGFLIIYDWK